MKLTEQRKNICILLMFMILVSGMCFDIIKTDACFSSVHVAQQTRAVYIDKNDIDRQPAYVEEKAERNEIVSHTSGRTNSRKVLGVKNSGSFALTKEISPEKSFWSFIDAACKVQWEHSDNAAIISYVHHQDGSKG